MLLALSGQTFPSEMLPALPSASMNGVYETESKEDPSRLEASLTAEGTWTLFGNFKIGHPGLHICDRGPLRLLWNPGERFYRNKGAGILTGVQRRASVYQRR